MGNAFLSHIREADAICQVTRVFDDPDVTHVDGAVNPPSDIETIATELILADLQTIERALPRLEKEARINKDKVATLAAVKEAQEVLDRGPGRASPPAWTVRPLRELFLLTAKPFLYVFNCDSDELADEACSSRLRALVAPAEAIFLDAKIESELVEMEPDEARELLGRDGHRRAGPGRAGPSRLRHPRPADLPDGRSEGVAGLDDSQGGHRAGGGRSHPHRLPEGLHQGRDRGASTTWSRPARCRPPRPRAGFAWRARTT